MSINAALEALAASLDCPATRAAAMDAITAERGLLRMADQHITDACCQAAAGHLDLARQSILSAQAYLTASRLPAIER